MQNAGPFALALVFALAACGGGNGGTDPPPTPVFTSLSVSSATLNMVDGDTHQLTATPRDQNGAPMTGLPDPTFSLTPGSGTATSVSSSGLVTALAEGTATVMASLTSGGVTKTANTAVNVAALATTATVTASATGSTFSPGTVKVATGAQVTWSFPGTAHNVIWDAAEPPSGDIPTHSGGETESRTFPNNGSYPYHCSIHGASMSGEIIVRTP